MMFNSSNCTGVHAMMYRCMFQLHYSPLKVIPTNGRQIELVCVFAVVHDVESTSCVDSNLK